MKQRVITAIVLLALLAVVVWQIYTPLFVIVIAFLSAVAANEIMKCAKVSNNFILCAGTAFAFCVPFFASAHILEPLVSTPQWALVINKVPNIVFVIVLTLAFFLAMLKEYSHTKFEDVAVSFIASVVVPYGFSIFVRLTILTVTKRKSAFISFSSVLFPHWEQIPAHNSEVWRSESIKCRRIFRRKRLLRVPFAV